MKTTVALAVVALGALTGCRTATYLNPAYEKDTQFFSEFPITGIWITGDDVYKVSGDGAPYVITGQDGEKLHAHLIRIKDTLVMDLEPAATQELSVPVHLLAKVWMENDVLCVAPLDSDWLRQHFRGHIVEEGGDPLISAPTPMIRAVLEKYGEDPRAVSETARFRRPSAQ